MRQAQLREDLHHAEAAEDPGYSQDAQRAHEARNTLKIKGRHVKISKLMKNT